MELYEGKEYMQNKPYSKDLGATAATCLRLTEPYRGSGKIMIADSWFGSVKSAISIFKQNGLFCIMIVKTAHREFPRLLSRRGNSSSNTDEKRK